MLSTQVKIDPAGKTKVSNLTRSGIVEAKGLGKTEASSLHAAR